MHKIIAENGLGIAVALSGARGMRGFNQSEMGRMLGVSQAVVSRLENREDDLLTIGRVRKYLETIGCKLEVHIIVPDDWAN